MIKFKFPTRLRAQPRSWGREPLLVIQVQASGHTEGDPRDPLDTGQPFTAWRDATVSDMEP